MKGGRKNLKRAAKEESLILQEGQTIMQVVSLRGSNIIEVMDAGRETSLAPFPAKFQKSMWIKQGSFVVVDESGREKALESGCKVTCMVSRVLFYKQVCALQKSTEWTKIFKITITGDSNGHLQRPTSQHEQGDWNSSDDDGVPPLEANLNRIRPVVLHSDSESDADK